MADEYLNLADPYSVIEAFWGEPLTNELVARIELAPLEHVQAFDDFCVREVGSVVLPSLEVGRLRPIVASNFEDRLVENSLTSLRPAYLASSLLVYSHEVLVEDVLPFICSENSDVRTRACTWLLAIKELHESGCVHFQGVESRRRHPSNHTLRADLDQLFDSYEPDASDGPYEIVGRWPDYFSTGDAAGEFEDAVIESMAFDIEGTISLLEGSWRNKANFLARSYFELGLYRRLQSPGSSPLRSSEMNLANLAAISLPHIAADFQLLAKLRASEETFAELRTAITSALDRVEIQDMADADEIARARTTVYEYTEPLRVRAERVVSQSPVLAAVRAGASTFGFALTGAIAGYAVGGSIGTSLVSAASSKVAEVGANYLRERAQQRDARNLAAVVTTFVPPNLSSDGNLPQW